MSSHSLKIARSGLYPSLDLDGSATLRNTHTDPEGGSAWDSDNTSLRAGISLNWSLFQGGRQDVARQRAKIDQRRSRLQLVQMEADIEADWQSALSTWHSRREQLALAQSSRALAERQLSLREEEYNLGRSGALDFRDAQISLASARRAEVEAQVQLQLARLELERLQGNLSGFLDAQLK